VILDKTNLQRDLDRRMKMINLDYDIVFSKELADELGVPKPNQIAINEIHDTRRDIFNSVEKMMKTGYKKEAHPTIFKELYDEWMELERDLQLLWGFGLDDNKIKFWNFPACSCPAMDNNNAYPYGYYAMSGGCMIHGSAVQGE
jgi:hypothetical protein